MPVLRKLSPTEVRTLEYGRRGKRNMIAAQYDELLRDFGPGDYGAAELEPNERRVTVQKRLRAAAERRGLSLAFHRTRGNELRFQITNPTSKNERGNS